MALGGGMSCVKYLLFCFNLLFAITGLIILIVGAKAEINSYPYINLTDENFYTSGPIVLIIVGLLVFIVAFFGCCGAVRENHCMIVTFSVFLLLIFVAEVAVGIAGYVKHEDLETSVMKHLNESLKEYPTNVNAQKTMDILQVDLQCCGVNSPDDWVTSGQAYPTSCCAEVELQNGEPPQCVPTSPSFHKTGCYNLLVTHLKDISLVLGGVGIGIAVVQLMGVIFACCLARSIRSQYETV